MKRRTQEGFREHAAETDQAVVKELLAAAKEQYAVVQRQTVVYSLFARQHKSVMVRRTLCTAMHPLITQLSYITE